MTHQRDNLPDNRDIGTIDNDRWRLQGWARWGVRHSHRRLARLHRGRSWGGFFASNSGLDAVSLSYEINCRPSSPWAPADEQVYADNVRNVLETGVVTAAAKAPGSWPVRGQDEEERRLLRAGRARHRQGREPKPGTDDLGEPISGPAAPGPVRRREHRLLPRSQDNSSTARPSRSAERARWSSKQLDQFRRRRLDRRRHRRLSATFVKGGGDLILTDSALQMLPELTKIDKKAVNKELRLRRLLGPRPQPSADKGPARNRVADVRADSDRLSPADGARLATGTRARTTRMPATRLRPRTARRSGPVDRDAWEAAGGETVGTADPPADRKSVEEGNNVDGARQARRRSGQDRDRDPPVGKGRIVIFGALLPQPTEKYPHWFGLNAYSISTAGQTMLLRVMRGEV